MLNLYESEEFSQISGPSLRPGGLEVTRAILDLCALPPGAAVLDVGCGNGTTMALLADSGYLAYGLDISPKLLQIAAQAVPVASFYEGSAQAMAFADAMFDAVLGECVLSLMADPAAMLRECRRTLRPDGFLCLSDIYIRDYRACAVGASLNHLQCCLRGALRQEELTALISGNGFEVIHFSDHTKLLKQLTAELIFAHGSLQAFWDFFLGVEAARGICARGHKYGYYALVAVCVK